MRVKPNDRIFMKISPEIMRDVTLDKEKLIEFWKSSASESGSRNYLKDSSTLRDRAVPHFDKTVRGIY